ncbi:MAG: DUF5107 domain-containing protein [Marinilabiliaceae bacterium]|jgi:tetratricopeptide (TPR) repeat protein|nr:DUF5107 domain-containing protein [Marinilabiliaceae bacterium]
MKKLLILFWFFLFGTSLSAQYAKIREEKVPLRTYMFSDESPVPNIGHIYPYSRFDGFTSEAREMDWNMVILENEHIEVWVCPDIGGKIWGAKEKSTGKEFLYFNNVVKFRDVAMRGPWTSGGLEFNFGDIGHIPTCATPVDYKILENPDGSVSCVVGAIDLPSGTRWNIDIKVSPGKAFFETKVSWFNNTGLSHTYYHWMNAAAKAAGKLEFIYPGKNHIGHGGEPGTWPVENGRDISWYDNNDFGTYKSYHVINSYSDFFGGYWHDDDFGFGHYATYDDKPGKKLWIWGLSDQGMIWEDLLTDNDGQYIEFQAGKLFNQAAFSSTLSPFKHREFGAYDADIMNEIFFPIKETGGMLAMSEYAVLNIEYGENVAKIYLSALQSLDEELHISVNGENFTESVRLNPLELFSTVAECSESDILKIELGNKLLEYSGKAEDRFVNRPLEKMKDFNRESAYGLYTEALELEKQRMYAEAYKSYQRVLDLDPGHLPSIGRIALAHYRRMEYSKAVDFARKGLSIDTYDPLSNYVYGLANTREGKFTEAKSGFSIASHDPATRPAAYLELAKIFIREGNAAKAKEYAIKSSDYNRNNIAAYELMLYAESRAGSEEAIRKYADIILQLDPLSDFARFEEYRAALISEEDFLKGIRNEFPFESFMDLALKYYNYGDRNTALDVLKLSPGHTLVKLWIACLDNKPEELDSILDNSGSYVFPHRAETAAMLADLTKINDSWLLKYYLGLIYWNKGLVEEAKDLFGQCGDKPDEYWFWLAKAQLFDDEGIKETALLKAYELEPKNWRTVVDLSGFLIENGNPGKAAELCGSINPGDSENPKLGLTYARALYNNQQLREALGFLEDFVILPYEGSVDGKKIFTEVCNRLAVEELNKGNYRTAISFAEKAKEWPLNLGVGKPYDVDERMEDFIIAFTDEQRNRKADYSRVASYRKPGSQKESSRIIFQLLALEKAGRKTEALELLNRLREEDGTNIYLEWAKARFTGNKSLARIEKMILDGDISVQAYDTKFVDKDFRFIMEILGNLGL